MVGDADDAPTRMGQIDIPLLHRIINKTQTEVMKIFHSFWHSFSADVRAFNRFEPVMLKRMIMRLNLTILAITIAYLQVAASSVLAQQISINVKNTPLKTVLQSIGKQSGYQFFYKNNSIRKSTNVTIILKSAPLKQALEQVMKDQPLNFEIVDKTIVISEKKEPTSSVSPQQNISGTVTNERGDPLPGVTITVKGTDRQTASDSKGNFIINANSNQALVFTFLGYNPQEKKIDSRTVINVTLTESVDVLNQVQIIAYGSTTRRLNTGSVATVSAKDIANQPVANPLATLVGRVPGLVITQQSGVPGSSFSIQIRGRNSISQGSQPLILIDGIPFAAGNENLGLITSAMSNFTQGSGVSPFNSISPADIESIEILKDADATAIYGSRGANGVILVTTKKGKAGKTEVTANFNQGITQVGKLPTLLNTEQYLAMRKEAFINAGTTPSTTNAPDLLTWDTNRYTDYQKEFLGGTGHITNANLSISGGGSGTQFMLSGNYYRETTIYPGNLPNQRGGVLANITHRSADNRLNVAFSGNFTSVLNTSPTTDLMYYTYISPNTPEFLDASGHLIWNQGGITYDNPYAYLKEDYSVQTNNVTGSMNASYNIWRGLSAKVLLGYNQQFTNEQLLSPADAKNPVSTLQGPTTKFGRNQYNTWNAEPQLEYKADVWKGKLNVLIGGAFNAKNSNNLYVEGSGYSSDALMETFDAASTIDASSIKSQYRYQALFGRVNYNIADKYLLNLTGRRDGSSRFGPGKQFSNFGAVGVAWIFTSEKWLQNLPVLSFGKLRGSYGVTGNDQIGDYQFVETWQPTDNTYQGASGLTPSTIYNSGYAWEKNNKLEMAIDLGFLKDRLLLSVNYFQNRSGNQLVNYRLPYTTGFNSILANFPAKVENKGWEFVVSGTAVKADRFKWNSNFNITLPTNTLVAFPDIETSSYSDTYKVGQSLSIINNLIYLGVDPQTGLAKPLDVNNSGTYDRADYQIIGNRDPEFYGAWQNTFSFAGIELQVFFDFKKQLGRNENYYIYSSFPSPGAMRNQNISVLNRWQNIGDITNTPKFLPNSTATNVGTSSFGYSDQSYIRLRNVSLSYNLPGSALSKIGAKLARIYLQGQNLYTFNRNKGYDPETQNMNVLPALRAYTLGLQISY